MLLPMAFDYKKNFVQVFLTQLKFTYIFFQFTRVLFMHPSVYFTFILKVFCRVEGSNMSNSVSFFGEVQNFDFGFTV